MVFLSSTGNIEIGIDDLFSAHISGKRIIYFNGVQNLT
jgi:hypothetical protein